MIYRFILTYNSVDTTVIEPKGWDAFKSELNRDFKSHGVIFKYTSGTLKLGFADGRTLLESAFQLEGFDADVMLTVDQRADEFKTWENTFTGNAVMKNRELSELYFSVDFEGSSFQQKVINRLKTKVKLDSLIDLDGNTLSDPITEQSGQWNSIRLKTDYIADYRSGGVSSDFTSYAGAGLANGVSGNDVFQYMIMNFNGVIDSELKEVNVLAAEQIIDVEPSLSSSYNNFTASISGDLTFTFNLKFRLSATLDLTDEGAVNTNIQYDLVLRRDDGVGVNISETILATDNQSGSSPLTHNFGIVTESGSSTISVDAGDTLYYYIKVTGDGVNATNSPYSVLIDPIDIDIYHSSKVTYSILKASTTTTVKSFLIHDVIDRILYLISGENNNLYSDFLGLTDHGYLSDGCGGKMLITNGGKLRDLTTSLTISLNDTLESIMAIWGLGWGFEKTYDGSYRVRIELLEHFYQDQEILDLGSPISIKENGSYKETISDDLTFNNVNVGFSKFSDDEDYSNNIEDFLTISEYSLPITSITGDYVKVSKFIASGRLIQATFEATDLSKRWKYDNNNFIISAVRSSGTFVPENDQNFESVGGLDDATTAYNIRLAPVYSLLNHALIVNSVMMGKPLGSLIQNTLAEINLSFNATFSSYEVCLLGDSQRLQRSSVGNISIGDNYEGLRLFDPIEHELTVAMTSSQLNTIIDALENNSTDPTKDLGYLTYRDNEGNIQQGYPLNIKWNTNDETADIITLEKADNYGI